MSADFQEPNRTPLLSHFAEGGEVRRLLVLAWPVVLGQLGLMSLGVADTVMVGHLGQDPLAAVGLGNMFSFGLLIILIGLSMGLDPVFAQAFGAKQPKQAGKALYTGALFLGVFSVPMFILHWHAGSLLAWIQQPPELLGISGEYCRVLSWSIPAFAAFTLLRQYLQADGNMRPAMWAILWANILNILANWVFIYGHLGFEPMGPVGAGWATILCRWIMFAHLLILVRHQIRGSLSGAYHKAWTVTQIKRIGFVSLPVGGQAAVEVWAFNCTTIMAGWISAQALASHIIALNLASITFMLPLGISAAAATRVGNLLGANKAWGNAAWTAVSIGVALLSVSAVIFWLFPNFLAGLYTNDLALVAVAATLIPIAALFQLMDATQVVVFGVLRGVGDTRIPPLFNVVGYWFLGLPLGAYFAFTLDWGIHGVWWGLTISLSVLAVMLLIRLQLMIRRGGFRMVQTD